MDVIILIVSLIGWKVSGIDFMTLYFYLNLSNTLWKAIKRYINDKTARRYGDQNPASANYRKNTQYNRRGLYDICRLQNTIRRADGR